MQTIKVIEKDNYVFKLDCDMDLIPLDVVEQTVNHVAKIVRDKAENGATDAFLSTKDGKALWEAWKEIKFLKRLNRLLYIIIVALSIYFTHKLTH